MDFKKKDKESEEAPEKVLAALTKGKFHSCYLLYGEEEYLLKDALRKIIDHIIPEKADRDFNLFYMDGDRLTVDSLCDALLTVPMMPGRMVILLRDTTLFQSRDTIPSLIQKIRDRLEKDTARAARDFMAFIKTVGWSLDDLANEGWKKITDEEWQEATGMDDGGQRALWIPKAIDISARQERHSGPFREGTERLEGLLAKGLPEGHHLILTTDIVDKRKKLFKIISEVGAVLHFPQIKGETKQKNKVIPMVNRLLGEHGKSLSADAWSAVGKKTGYHLRNTLGVIEQLLTYTGERKIIEAEDVEAAIGKTKGDSVFDLTAALVDKDPRKSLRTLQELHGQGVNHVLIHSVMAREIRLLLHAKIARQSGQINFGSPMDYGHFQKNVYPSMKESLSTKGLEEISGRNPYAVYLALKSAERFTLDQLVRYLEKLVEMDIAFKSTTKDPQRLLERFILEVCS